MSDPIDHGRETQRLGALARYQIMDTPGEAEFDDIVKVAALICDVPMALISLVDAERQWFKAALGVPEAETPREIAFCAHAIQQAGVMVVEDATRDARFVENPLVTGETHLRFYAGAPLETPDGFSLGTLCVLDTEPRELNEDQAFALKALARQVMTQLELRRALAQQREADARHRQILDSAIDYGIITMDLDGMVTSWNVGAERVMGWTEDEMCGRPCDAFFTPEDRQAEVPAREMSAALATGRGTDERWHLHKDGTRFWASGEMMPLKDDAGVAIGFLKILRDRTEARAAEEQRKLLTSELQHRVKNTLSMVQAIVSQSLRDAATPRDARDAIAERLVTLGRAHDLLTQTNWTAASMAEVVAAAIDNSGFARDRFEVEGPPIELGAKAALALALALHELNTNAVKYGALSNAAGKVALTWSVQPGPAGRMLRLAWREHGGPTVTPPTRSGFGSRLIQAGLASDLGGKGRLEFAPDGLVWTLDAALDAVSAQQ